MPLTFLLETGFWGLPPVCAAIDPKVVQARLTELLAQEQFPVARLRIWLSSIRFAVLAEGIPETQSERLTEVRGPKASVAFNIHRMPTPAAMGFASAQGVEVGDLVIREVDGEQFVFARKKEKGAGFSDALPKLLPRILGAVPWGLDPWGAGMLLPHPPAYAVLLVDDKMPSLAIDGVTVSRETCIRETGGLKRLPISHAHEFPRLMQNAGISALPTDRVKLIESQFQTVVPEGTSVRRDSCSLLRTAFEFERPKVFSVPFPEKDCPVSGVMMNFELAGGPAWFALQKDNGSFVGTLCGVLENRLPQPAEIELRCKALRRRLQQLATGLEQDQSRPLRERVNDLRLIPAVLGGGTRYDQAVRVSRRAKALAEKLQIQVAETAIDQTVFYTFCGNTLQLSRLLPTRVVAVVALLASMQEVAPEVREALQDLGQCGLGTEVLPVTSVGALVAAGWLLDQIYMQPETAVTERARWAGDLLRLITGRKWNLDLSALATEPKDLTVTRDFWEDRLAKMLAPIGYSGELHGRLLKAACLDPMGVMESVKGWPEGGNKELDALAALAKKILTKCGSRVQNAPVALPASAQEEAFEQKLKEAEQIWPGRIKALTDALYAARADVEACMMDMPPVIEELDHAWHSRLTLLMRFIRLVSRLPGITLPEPGKIDVPKNPET